MTGRSRMRKKIQQEAKSHADDCQCKTCRAASGDKQAERELMDELL